MVLQADFSTEQFEEASLTKLAKVTSVFVVCDLNFPLTLPVFLEALGTKSTCVRFSSQLRLGDKDGGTRSAVFAARA